MTSRCRVVLVEPRDARNVGMVARACANFGVKDLVVVHSSKFSAALGRADRSEAKARQLGICKEGNQTDEAATSECRFDISSWSGCERLATQDGAEILQDARLCGNLSQAIAGARRAIAFSGREGDNFRRPTIALRELAREVAKQPAPAAGSGSLPTALVFGSEDVGLPTDALLQCDGICQLRTAGCMSLNLSHAVAVTLARLLDEEDALDVESPSASVPVPVSSDACSRPRSKSRSPARGLSRGTPAAAEREELQQGAVSFDSQRAPGVWTTEWMELCRARLEAQGYPTNEENWCSKGRRKCKFAYRLFKIVSGCARTLQRAHPTPDESESWMRLVGALSTKPLQDLQQPSERSVSVDVSLRSDVAAGNTAEAKVKTCESVDSSHVSQ